jgi:hypothetical protein
MGSNLYPRLALILRSLVHAGRRDSRRSGVSPIIACQLGGRLDYNQGLVILDELYG